MSSLSIDSTPHALQSLLIHWLPLPTPLPLLLFLLLLLFLFALLPLPPLPPILAQSMSAMRPMLENFASHSAVACLMLSIWLVSFSVPLFLSPSFPSSLPMSVCGLWPWLVHLQRLVLCPPSFITFLGTVLFVVVKSFGILLSKLFCNYFHLPRHAIPLLLDPLTPPSLTSTSSALASPLALPCCLSLSPAFFGPLQLAKHQHVAVPGLSQPSVVLPLHLFPCRCSFALAEISPSPVR